MSQRGLGLRHGATAVEGATVELGELPNLNEEGAKTKPHLLMVAPPLLLAVISCCLAYF